MNTKIELYESYNKKLELLKLKREDNNDKMKNLIVVNNYFTFELEHLNYRLEYLNSYKNEIMYSKEILKNLKKNIIVCYPFMCFISIIVTLLFSHLITRGNVESIKNMLVISSSISVITFTRLGIKHYFEKKKYLNENNLNKIENSINEVNNELYLRNYKIKRNQKKINELKNEISKINIEIDEIINKLNVIQNQILLKENKFDQNIIYDVNNNKTKKKIKKL